jgi:lipoate-protein ligase A
MHTKGVASVRSPVRNIVQSTASVTHEAFVGAVIRSFKEEYAIDEEVSSRLSHNRFYINISDAAMFRSRNVALSRG